VICRDDAELAAFVAAYHPQVANIGGDGSEAGDVFGQTRRQLLNAIATILMRP